MKAKLIKKEMKVTEVSRIVRDHLKTKGNDDEMSIWVAPGELAGIELDQRVIVTVEILSDGEEVDNG